jgi:uncharacterized membrane protein YidH (DUF202 family)
MSRESASDAAKLIVRVITYKENQKTMTQETANAADPRVELADERTDLAKFPTQLGLDRTTLAWISTTLTITTFPKYWY